MERLQAFGDTVNGGNGFSIDEAALFEHGVGFPICRSFIANQKTSTPEVVCILIHKLHVFYVSLVPIPYRCVLGGNMNITVAMQM